MKKKAITLSLMALIVGLFFSFVYATQNPVINFVQEDTGINLQSQNNQSNQNSQQSNENSYYYQLASKVANSISNLYNKVTSLFSNSNIGKFSIVCVPDTMEEGEKMLLAYKCPTLKSQKADIYISKKNDSKNAKIRNVTFTYSEHRQEEPKKIITLDPEKDWRKIYVFCGDEYYGSCNIAVASTSIEISASKDGDRATITWDTKGMKSCTLSADTKESWTRTGVSGSVVTFPITTDTKFTLECESIAGHTHKKSVKVRR